MKETLINFENVTKNYNSFRALNDINLTINKKDFAFIVGPSGAGKSTIIKLLIREESPTEGTITFDNTDINNIPYKDLSTLRRKIGVVFQDFKLLDSRTVYENVAIALEVTDTLDREIKQIVPNVLNMVGLLDKADVYPKSLSGGEKQRVSIARALAHEPLLLVLDEPTGMIDPDAADEVLKILEKINKLGTTIIMTTHNEQLVNKLKKRVIRLEKGNIVFDKKSGGYRD